MRRSAARAASLASTVILQLEDVFKVLGVLRHPLLPALEQRIDIVHAGTAVRAPGGDDVAVALEHLQSQAQSHAREPQPSAEFALWRQPVTWPELASEDHGAQIVDGAIAGGLRQEGDLSQCGHGPCVGHIYHPNLSCGIMTIPINFEQVNT